MTMIAATANPATPATYGQGRRKRGLPVLSGAGSAVGVAAGVEAGSVALTGGMSPASCWAVLRAASAAARVLCPGRGSLIRAVAPGPLVNPLPPHFPATPPGPDLPAR